MKEEKNCCEAKSHPDHSAQLSRLNRVSGQVEGVKKMINERRYCPDILVQLRALRSAINSVEANILEAHLDACVTDVLSEGSKKKRTEKIAELKDLYRRFNE